MNLNVNHDKNLSACLNVFEVFIKTSYSKWFLKHTNVNVLYNSFCSILPWHSCFYTIILFLSFQNKFQHQSFAWTAISLLVLTLGRNLGRKYSKRGKNDTRMIFFLLLWTQNYNCVFKHVLKPTFKSLFSPFQAETFLFV